MSACIFGVQPESCRLPLPKKEIKFSTWQLERPKLIERYERVLFYDPSGMYQLISKHIDPFKRIHAISIDVFFPSEEGICKCGCERELPKGRKAFFDDACAGFAWDIRNIICNVHQTPHKYISMYYGRNCIDCVSDRIYDMQLDHIVGVKQGGGGSWLSNYRWLCHTCHVAKTNKDFNRKSKVSSLKNQTRIEL